MENALYDFYSLVELYQKLNSWIKIVRAHFPWNNLYFSITHACGPFMLIAYMMENGQAFVLWSKKT